MRCRSAGPLAQAQAAALALQLEHVPDTAWGALCLTENSTFSLEIDVHLEHISVKALSTFAQAVEAVQEAGASDGFWEWMALPADADSALSRTQALVATLAQAVGTSPDLAAASGCAYLGLLAAKGAEHLWGTLFQPSVFRQVLQVVRVLRIENCSRTADDDGGVDSDIGEGVDTQSNADVVLAGVTREEAAGLLAVLLALLRTERLHADSEAASLVLSELAALVLRPSEETFAREAATGLSAIIAGAGDPGRVRRMASAALHSVIPAVLMTQVKVRSSTTLSRSLLAARSVAIGFIRSVLRDHPGLVNPLEGQFLVDRDREGSDRADDSTVAPTQIDDDGSDFEENAAEEQIGKNRDVPGKRAGAHANNQHGVDDPVIALLQRICILAPERIDWRTPAAESTLALLGEAFAVEESMPRATEQQVPENCPARARQCAGAKSGARDACNKDHPGRLGSKCCGDVGIVSRFLTFLEKLLHCDHIPGRIIAVDVAAMMVEQWAVITPSQEATEERARLAERLLSALRNRCSDAVPSVRSRGLCGLGAALLALSKHSEGSRFLHTTALEEANPHHMDLRSLFRAAAADERALVRRAALGFLEAALQVLRSSLSLGPEALGARFELDMLSCLANDDSTLVRKASVSTLSMLLRICPLQHVRTLWVSNVLPLTLDVDGSVVERALEEVELAIVASLAKIEEQGPGQMGAGSQSSVLPNLPLVLYGLNSESTQYLQHALRCLAKRNHGSLPVPFVVALGRVVRECLSLPLPAWPRAVWSMLEEVAAIGSETVPAGIILNAWEVFDAAPECIGKRDSFLGVQILRVLEHVMPRLPQATSSRLAESFFSALSSFIAPAEQVRAMLRVMRSAESSPQGCGTSSEDGGVFCARRTLLARAAEEMILAWCSRPGVGDLGAEEDEQRRGASICGCLFTFGELVLAQSEGAELSGSVTAAVQTIATNNVERSGHRAETDSAIRGHAFATLGKLCLRHEVLAKKLVELFVLHLHDRECFTVRNNVLVVLGDLCVHYTSLVDRFVPHMTDLLQDVSPLLRKQSAMLLASLISEDFLKFRGSIVPRFLYALSDPCDDVRHFVESFFARVLLARNSAIFAQSLVDAVCTLTGWLGHPRYQGAAGNRRFSLRAAPARRAAVYRFMLSLMTNKQKFSVCSQIVTGFLAPFVEVEDAISLPRSERETGGQALSDVLALLSCKEMRICFSTKQTVLEEGSAVGSGVEQGSISSSGCAPGSAEGEVVRDALSSLLKQVMCESIVPVLAPLKHLMEEQRSPFLRQLRCCLCSLMREFKDDLKVIFSGDARLAEEIAFDLHHDTGLDREDVGETPGLFGASSGSGAASGSMGMRRRHSLQSMMPAACDETPRSEKIIDVTNTLPTGSSSRKRKRTTDEELTEENNVGTDDEGDQEKAVVPPARRVWSKGRLPSTASKPVPAAKRSGKVAAGGRGQGLAPSFSSRALRSSTHNAACPDMELSTERAGHSDRSVLSTLFPSASATLAKAAGQEPTPTTPRSDVAGRAPATPLTGRSAKSRHESTPTSNKGAGLIGMMMSMRRGEGGNPLLAASLAASPQPATPTNCTDQHIPAGSRNATECTPVGLVGAAEGLRSRSARRRHVAEEVGAPPTGARVRAGGRPRRGSAARQQRCP